MTKYENILILGDFNSAMSEEAMEEFCQPYDLDTLIKEQTSYKNADNPSSIDVILTNKKEYFANNSTMETGILDHHKMVITVLRVYVNKNTPVTINYRSYKKIDISQFRNELKENLETFGKINMTYEDFERILMSLLNSHAPMTKKVTRGNHRPFMDRTLSKEVMNRSKLKNKFNKNPTEENKIMYKKQRNDFVHLLKNRKKATTIIWT